MKKITPIILSSILMLSSTACSFGKKGNPDIIDGKKVLRVAIFDGGWGAQWLDKCIEEFEADYPEYKVIPNPDKKYDSNYLTGAINIVPEDVFITTCYLNEFISKDLLLDISDVMTAPLNTIINNCTETKSVKDKMWKDIDDYYLSYDGKYYGVPFGGSIFAINYDIDLFNENKYFIGKDTAAPNIKWVSENEPRSVGQDGIEGTYDDGLPVTYADYELLMRKMKSESIIPYIYSNMIGYTGNLLYSMFASYEGKENFDNMKYMRGEYTFEGDSTPTKIDHTNAYLLQGMTGKKKAIQFAYDIVRNGWAHPDSGSVSLGFMDAQDQYLMSKKMAKKGRGKRVAFLIDGSHWLHEANDTLTQMAEESDEYKNRRFGIMPFPQFEGTKAKKTTYYASGFYTTMFAKKTAKQPEIAKKFIAYLQTEKSLQTCNEISGMRRAINYEMPQEKLNNMNIYYQKTYDAFTNTDVVYHTCSNPYLYLNEQYFEGAWKWMAKTPTGRVLNEPFNSFKAYADLTVDDYFEALKITHDEYEWRDNVLGE